MNARFSIRSVAALSAAVGLLVAASQAEAHAHLVSATPTANATVAAPKTITLHFSEKLEPKFSGLELMTADGAKVDVASSVPATDRKTITGTVAGQLAPGAYMVTWHVVSDDGHRIKGDFNFTVH